MTTQPDKSKRWRPRFSVRTLVIVVTLVCCYAACWGPTKGQGVKDVERYVQENPHASLFSFHESDVWLIETVTMPLVPLVVASDSVIGERRYYFWFFGCVAKLPYERGLATFPGYKAPQYQ